MYVNVCALNHSFFLIITVTCFPNTNGFPPCCTDSTCTAEYPPCEDPVNGGDPLGASICTNSPNMDCWPNTFGWPPCCASDPSSCPSQSEFEAGVNSQEMKLSLRQANVLKELKSVST